ncbi:hypothetical protein ANCDUO_12050 [Ancylostoma duodenale]|uniref:Uncharacterized protein n=1 Tax=Ancylostoma duodenale TaxID=51022 RepID=A0A0C2GFU1_9BILA|nr:hypothetical protein ANCDUO_12050 [Ancylostoma duodenale]
MAIQDELQNGKEIVRRNLEFMEGLGEVDAAKEEIPELEAQVQEKRIDREGNVEDNVRSTKTRSKRLATHVQLRGYHHGTRESAHVSL